MRKPIAQVSVLCLSGFLFEQKILFEKGAAGAMVNKKSYRNKRFVYSLVAIVAAFAITVGAGKYSEAVLNPTELSHFFVPFPAGKVVKPMTVAKPNGEMIFTRPMVINVNERGILKRLFNPQIEGLSTHWLVNVDDKPHRIGMELTETEVPIRWEVAAGIPWDPDSKTFEEAVGPGESVADLGVDWYWLFPEETRARDVWYEGRLVVFDADTGEELTIIPIKFQIGGANGDTWGAKKT